MAPAKVKRFCYQPSKVSNALHEIRKGISFSKASRTYGIPRSNICHKIAGRAPESIGHSCPPPIFVTNMEENIVDWILDIVKMGFPINKDNLLDSIQKFFKREE